MIKDIFNFDNPKYAVLRNASRNVIKAYQDANRWMDTTQEYVYIEQGMPNFARIIHNQAHEYPKLFDEFVDMLHERHLMGEYPATEELNWREELKSVEDVFGLIIRIFEHINEALEDFHKATDNAEFRAMALKTEEFMLKNSQTYTVFLELANRWDDDRGSKTSFDSWCEEYLDD